MGCRAKAICTYVHTITSITYGTAQFKLHTRVQAHACACTFNACKTSKTDVCMHRYTQF